MPNSENQQLMLYLAANEFMQTYMSCSKFKEPNKEDFLFVIRTFCYIEEEEEGYAQSAILKIILGLNKDGMGMTLAVDLLNIPNAFPIQLKRIVEHVQKSPTFLQVVSYKLDQMAATADYETVTQISRAKQFLIQQSPTGITSFTTDRQAKQVFWLKHNDELIFNLSPFSFDDTGGHIAFTIKTGFKHEFTMQCYEVECMMHLFNEGDKLGYYFELYLDQDNYHHQLLYEALPDMFMDNKVFLNQVLQEMKTCNEQEQNDSLEELIMKFTASI